MTASTTPEVVRKRASRAPADATSTRTPSGCPTAGVHAGEVAVQFAPLVDISDGDDRLARSVDTLLRRTSLIARALTGAEQSALALAPDGDPANARKYFSLSKEYESYRDFRVNPRGYGLHGMAIPPGEVVRLTQDEVVSHPLWRNFGAIEAQHPPMRGWLASSIGGEDGRIYGLLQLTDKSEGRDFDADDEEHIRELTAFVGETLDALCAASSTP